MNIPRVVLPAAAIALASCSFFGPGATGELRDNQEKWEQLRLGDYSYHYRISCFCGFPANGDVRITVRDGEAVSVVAVATGDSVGGIERGLWPTINGLFTIAEGALGRAADLTIEYDPDFFFPSTISIDWRKDTIDDEEEHSASGLASGVR